MPSSSGLALWLVFALGAVASGQQSPLDLWVANEDAAASASKLAHFAEAEKLLLANEKLAATFPPKDARLPRTTFDLAQIFRAEGKYSEALPRYERALQIYSQLYGPEFFLPGGRKSLQKSFGHRNQGLRTGGPRTGTKKPGRSRTICGQLARSNNIGSTQGRPSADCDRSGLA
jgi:tetratricopeptide (TPR) repeat protein